MTGHISYTMYNNSTNKKVNKMGKNRELSITVSAFIKIVEQYSKSNNSEYGDWPECHKKRANQALKRVNIAAENNVIGK